MHCPGIFVRITLTPVQMLTADGVATCDLQQLLSSQQIIGQNQRFLDRLNDNTHTPHQRLCLCVMQGETATVRSNDLQPLVGSQDATTCVIAILSCPETAVVWSAHLDYPQLGDQDVAGIRGALRQMQRPQLYLVGGYCDDAGRGPELVQSFLQLLHSMGPSIHVQLCCVASANTSPEGAPRCCQLVLDTATWQPHPWLFLNRGPEVPRRFVAQHCRHDPRCILRPVWDLQQQQLVLPPFDTSTSSWQLMRYERLVAMPDKELLQFMSTSPDHEPDWFCQDMRNMLSWLIAAQEKDSPEHKAAASTSRYSCSSEGTWELVHEPAAASAASLSAAAVS